MANIVLFTTRAITSKFTKSLIEQMCILKEYQDKGYGIVFVTPKKVPKNTTYIEEVTGMKIDKTVSYADEYERCMKSPRPIHDSWYHFIESEHWFKDLEDISEIVIFGGILSDAGKLTREWATKKDKQKSGLDVQLDTKAQMNFVAHGPYITGMLQLIKISRERNIPVHEICYDPCENSISLLPSYAPYKYYGYHGYDWPEYNFDRLDSLQQYLLKKDSALSFFEDPPQKTIDLCFGFTAFTSHRETQYDNVMEALGKCSELTTKIFLRHRKLNIDTFVERDIYLYNIERSRYTLIIPPYDPKHFSIFRFLESIHNDCLPLITSDTYVNDFVKSFELDEDLINKITVDYSTIGDKINELTENDRQSLLEYFKQKCLVNDKKLKIGL